MSTVRHREKSAAPGRIRGRRTRVAVLPSMLIGMALALAACSGVSPTPLPKLSTSPSPQVSASGGSSSGSLGSATPSASPAPATCNPTQSFSPPDPMPAANALPAGSPMQKIRTRGRLIAAVSADTYLLGSRNPLTGQIEGFDIDMVRAIAQAILGDPNKVQLRVITAADRLPVLESHEVDVVVRNMTMNCDRWSKIAFSEVYYQAGQKILVRKGSDITGLATLAGHRVCAPTGTSSLDNLRRLAPKAEVVTAANHTGCLVALQQGRAEAITGDDTVLAGLAAQDPYAVVLQEKAFTQEPYGVGVAKDQPALAAYINGVFEQMRANGQWTKSYDKWLAPTLGKGTGQPKSPLGRTP